MSGSGRGAPHRIPLSQPNIGERERRYVAEAMASGWISGTGPWVTAFEEALAKRIGRRWVVAVTNGTVALELALAALRLRPGDEVIVPAFTFAAPAAAVLHAGGTPVLCDVEEESWTIDPAEVARLVTPRTRAIIAVDLMGHPCDFGALTSFGIPVIEDAAQAHGARYGDTPAGGFGTMSTFSFHANKAISTGEGGCVGTDDADLARRVRLLANHGMPGNGSYRHEVAGRNGRMTNLTAAIGVAQAERWDELVAARIAVATNYRRELQDVPGCGARPAAPAAAVSCWLYPAVLGNRDTVVDRVRARGIDARAVWPALSDLPLYRPFAPRPCPRAGRISATTAWLPTWAGMPGEDIAAVVAAVGDTAGTR